MNILCVPNDDCFVGRLLGEELHRPHLILRFDRNVSQTSCEVGTSMGFYPLLLRVL